MGESEFKGIVNDHSADKKYYMGKLVHYMVKYMLEDIKRRSQKEPVHNSIIYNKNNAIISEVDYFVNALQYASDVALDDTKKIVLEINCSHVDDEFSTNLQEKINIFKSEDYYKNMQVIKLSQVLPHEAYYEIDGHMNSDGHRLTAEEIAKVIKNWRH